MTFDSLSWPAHGYVSKCVCVCVCALLKNLSVSYGSLVLIFNNKHCNAPASASQHTPHDCTLFTRFSSSLVCAGCEEKSGKNHIFMSNAHSEPRNGRHFYYFLQAATWPASTHTQAGTVIR